MRRYVMLLALILAGAAWPGIAGAARFMSQTEGPPVGTTIDGFTEVLGPAATEPEHAGNFVNPLPEYMPTLPGRTCPSCAADRVPARPEGPPRN